MEDGAHSESYLGCTDLEGDSPNQDSNLVCRLGHLDPLIFYSAGLFGEK